ncbi:hypothetical protein AAX09_03805 [Moraxella bovoculi]|nr:hypothetical protein AAX09_03805 [Moraxella bovoculi]
MMHFERIFVLLVIDFIIIFNLGLIFGSPFAEHFMFKALPYYLPVTIFLIFFYYTISLFFKKVHNYYLVFFILFILVKEYCAVLLYGASIL